MSKIRGVRMTATPTPVPSEVAETTAGEREAACPWCHYGDPHPTFSDCPAEPDAGEVEALAKALYEQIEWGGCDGASWDRTGSGIRGHWTQAAERLHASDWLAALLDRVRREEGERIAQAIEELPAYYVQSTPSGGWMQAVRTHEAVTIARPASVGRDHA